MQRGEFLGNDLGRIKYVKAESKSLIFVNDLDVELPLWVVPRSDRIPEILSMEIGVLASEVLGLVPDQTSFALLRLPVPFDESRVTFISNKAEGMNAEAILRRVSKALKPLCIRPTMCL